MDRRDFRYEWESGENQFGADFDLPVSKSFDEDVVSEFIDDLLDEIDELREKIENENS